MLLPLTLHKFADALCLVPAAARATEAQAIIAEAEVMARKYNAGQTSRAYTWGHFLESVCLTRQNDWRVCYSVNAAPYAGLTDRDGLQAFSVAIHALDMMVVAAENQGVAA
jgi:hypothetical protein